MGETVQYTPPEAQQEKPDQFEENQPFQDQFERFRDALLSREVTPNQSQALARKDFVDSFSKIFFDSMLKNEGIDQLSPEEAQRKVDLIVDQVSSPTDIHHPEKQIISMAMSEGAESDPDLNTKFKAALAGSLARDIVTGGFTRAQDIISLMALLDRGGGSLDWVKNSFNNSTTLGSMKIDNLARVDQDSLPSQQEAKAAVLKQIEGNLPLINTVLAYLSQDQPYKPKGEISTDRHTFEGKRGTLFPDGNVNYERTLQNLNGFAKLGFLVTTNEPIRPRDGMSAMIQSKAGQQEIAYNSQWQADKKNAAELINKYQ